MLNAFRRIFFLLMGVAREGQGGRRGANEGYENCLYKAVLAAFQRRRQQECLHSFSALRTIEFAFAFHDTAIYRAILRPVERNRRRRENETRDKPATNSNENGFASSVRVR